MPTAQAIEELLRIKAWHEHELRSLGHRPASPENARRRLEHERMLDSLETALGLLGWAPPVDEDQGELAL